MLAPNQSVSEHLLFKTPGEKKKQKSVNATYPADRCRTVLVETLKDIPEMRILRKVKEDILARS